MAATRVFPLLAVMMCAARPAPGETATATQELTAQIAPQAKLAAPPAIVLAPGGQMFDPFTATLPLSYRARTTQGGGGAITMQMASDFTPGGGPSAGAGHLTYTCSGATLGAACSGIQTAGAAAQTSVLTIPAPACTGGGGPCSAADPNAIEIHFRLENSPVFQTGAYSAQITLIISSL